MSATVWFVAEHEDGSLEQESLETATAARVGDAEVVGVVCGGEVGDLGEELAPYADRVLGLQGEALETFSPDAFAQVLAEQARERRPDAIVLQHSHVYGRDLAPVLAARLGSGLVTDCVELSWKDGIEAVRSVYERKLVARQRFSGDGIALITCQRGAFLAAEPGEAGEVEIVDVEVEEGIVRWRLVSMEEAETAEHDITEADVVVAGGRGVGDEEKWELIVDLAELLGGAWGASRPIVDQGWAESERQIGSSGKTVRPRLYFAIGISGAIQHVVGMRNSDVIVAINKDPRAPIFEYADLGIVADLFDVVPVLNDRLRERRG